jgi:hypothetical protein
VFLFKRRKDVSQEQTALEKTESTIKLAKENTHNKSKDKEGSNSNKSKSKEQGAQSGKIRHNDQTIETDTPMKIVIPASSLLEEQDLSSINVPAANNSTVPEEDLDKLLIKVNQDEPVVEVPEISLDVHDPIKEGNGKTIQPPNKSEEKLESKPEALPKLNLDSKSESKTEMNTETKPPESKPDKDKTPKGDGKENLFSNIFQKVDAVEDNPTQRLINSLPDISIEEVINEAQEVNGLMQEWYVNQGKHVIK